MSIHLASVRIGSRANCDADVRGAGRVTAIDAVIPEVGYVVVERRHRGETLWLARLVPVSKPLAACKDLVV